jgi:hypothetical protein
LTGDRDDRVVPSHSFKYTAALQKAQSCNRPVLLRVERGTSHSYRPTDRRIAEVGDLWAFVAAQTGVKPNRGRPARRAETLCRGAPISLAAEIDTTASGSILYGKNCPSRKEFD